MTANDFCNCGHQRLEHRHSMTTLSQQWSNSVTRTFSQCAIAACDCRRFTLAPKPKPEVRKAEPSEDVRLFDV